MTMIDDTIAAGCSFPGCPNPTMVADISLYVGGPRVERFTMRGFCEEHAWHGQPPLFAYKDATTGRLDRYGLQIGIDAIREAMATPRFDEVTPYPES
ncbi:MAG: hypothetical protein M0027_15540 [Candidatus Dormibacteraeota bacterium]|nr:hypothetical protein [Candidatus Dormibacteraeota bacterium]